LTVPSRSTKILLPLISSVKRCARIISCVIIHSWINIKRRRQND
jgi:hypothetical protein